MAAEEATPERKRVVVCGGGVVGVCSAYFLAKQGLNVTLVEQSRIACAASGKAGGFLALDWCHGPVDKLARLSFKLHEELGEVLGHNYEYRKVSTLSLRVSEPKAEAGTIPRKSASGLPSWIDGPVSGVATIGTPSSTAQVNPKLFTQTLLEEATSKHNVAVKFGTVEEVEMEPSDSGGQRVRGVKVGGEVVPGEAVVLALGPWSSQSKLINRSIRISGLKANSVVLRPSDPGAISAHMVFLQYRANTGKVTDPEVYPRPSGLVYACGMSSDGEVPPNPDDIHPDPPATPYLQRVAATVSSKLQGAELVAAQACYLPCSEDGLPVIGQIPGVEGAFIATGHSCWGILNAPATGLAIAELIGRGDSTSVDISPFSPSRFVSASA